MECQYFYDVCMLEKLLNMPSEITEMWEGVRSYFYLKPVFTIPNIGATLCVDLNILKLGIFVQNMSHQGVSS